MIIIGALFFWALTIACSFLVIFTGWWIGDLLYKFENRKKR